MHFKRFENALFEDEISPGHSLWVKFRIRLTPGAGDSKNQPVASFFKSWGLFSAGRDAQNVFYRRINNAASLLEEQRQTFRNDLKI